MFTLLIISTLFSLLVIPVDVVGAPTPLVLLLGLVVSDTTSNTLFAYALRKARQAQHPLRQIFAYQR